MYKICASAVLIRIREELFLEGHILRMHGVLVVIRLGFRIDSLHNRPLSVSRNSET